MHEIKAVVRSDKVNDVLDALHAFEELPGAIISVVEAVGRQQDPRVAESTFGHTKMAKLELVVPDGVLDAVVTALQRAAHTGRAGDGKIFVSGVDRVVSIRHL